jgi:hypothetical protein
LAELRRAAAAPRFSQVFGTAQREPETALLHHLESLAGS